MDQFPTDEIYRIYNGIKKRKIERIAEIKGIVTPLLLANPELAKVLDIINEWKPIVMEETTDESGDI